MKLKDGSEGEVVGCKVNERTLARTSEGVRRVGDAGETWAPIPRFTSARPGIDSRVRATGVFDVVTCCNASTKLKTTIDVWKKNNEHG